MPDTNVSDTSVSIHVYDENYNKLHIPAEFSGQVPAMGDRICDSDKNVYEVVHRYFFVDGFFAKGDFARVALVVREHQCDKRAKQSPWCG